MDDATVSEFKLLITGIGLMITGAELLTLINQRSPGFLFVLGGGSLFVGAVLMLMSFNYPDSGSSSSPSSE
jgi:hypothetical protein